MNQECTQEITLYSDKAKIVDKGIINEVPYLIMSYSSPCAYIGVPIDHPLAGAHYDDLVLNCHGGLTYSDFGEGDLRPKEFYWFGWDYGHCDDYTKFLSPTVSSSGKQWTIEEIRKEIESVISEFKPIMRLAETIHKNIFKKLISNNPVKQ